MDKKRSFFILGIAETKDEGLIRGAYREKIVSVNPEDNPEGFKRLREAYEEALAYARKREQENGKNEKPDDPVSLYLEKLNNIYCSISRRLDVKEWEELTREEVLDDLDLCEDAKWGMFSYLMSHYRLPAKIWRVLDKAFGLVANEQRFKEHLNTNFVDFMCQKVSDQGEASEFPYHKLSGADTAEYDTFLVHFNELVNLMDKEAEAENQEAWLKEVGQKIAFLDSLGIAHPWFDLEKARYELNCGKKEEALEHARKLRESEPEDSRIIFRGTEILWKCRQEEEAIAAYEDFLKWDGLEKELVYSASLALAEIYTGKGDFLKAREHALRAWRLYNTDKVSVLMEKINTELIALYTGEKSRENIRENCKENTEENYKENTEENCRKNKEESCGDNTEENCEDNGEESLSIEDSIRLAWCFVQTRRAQEGWDFFKEHPLLEEDTAECHWVKAVMALACEQAEAVIRESRSWRRCIQTSEEESGEENRPEEQREYKLAQTYLQEGKGLQMLYMKEENKDSETAAGYKKAALEAFEEAHALQPENVDFLMPKMLFAKELHDYEEMAKLCERMKELNNSFYWAYFFMQEAYEGLHKAQEVVDTFYEAKRIYAGHAEIYERAVRVFWDYGQYQDAQNIIRQADEAGVSEGSFYLSLKKLELARKFASDEQALRKADELAAKLIAEFEEQKAPDDLLAEAYLERAFLHDDNRAQEFRISDKMGEWAKRSLELDDNVRTRYFLGRFYMNYEKDAKIAYEHFKVCEDRGMTFEWMYYYLAQCKEEFEEWDDAIRYYKKAVEKAPDIADFPWRIAWLYRRKYTRTGQRIYCDEAIKWLQIQKEKFGENARDLWQISDIHARLGEYETALEEIEQALKTSKRGRNLGHKAKMLVMLGKSEEAVPIYEEAIEVSLKNDVDYEYSYTQMEQYFTDRKDYEGGACWFTRMTQEKVVTDKQRHDNQDYIRNFYLKLKQWDKALDIFLSRYGKSHDKSDLTVEEQESLITLTGYVCESWEKEGERIEDILTIYKNMMPENELREMCRQAEGLLEGAGAEGLQENFNAKRGAYMTLGRIYSNNLLDDGKALFFFQKALEQISLGGDEIETSDYHGALEDAMQCCYQLGRLDEAKSYGRLLEESISKDYEECRELGKDWKELHENADGCGRRNLYQLFLISYFTGEHTQARQYLEQMENCRWCWWCSHKDCTELLECKGYIALLDGNDKEAAVYFERAVEAGWNGNADAGRELLRLQRKRHLKE